MNDKDLKRVLQTWIMEERKKANEPGLPDRAEMFHRGRETAYRNLLNVLEGKVTILLPR